MLHIVFDNEPKVSEETVTCGSSGVMTGSARAGPRIGPRSNGACQSALGACQHAPSPRAPAPSNSVVCLLTALTNMDLTTLSFMKIKSFYPFARLSILVVWWESVDSALQFKHEERFSLGNVGRSSSI